MKRKGILLAVLLLAVGFAAVTTTLFINGTTNVATNDSDFDIKFTEATPSENNLTQSKVNKKATAVIESDEKNITFTTQDLAVVGEWAQVDYEISNYSTDYDAEVTVAVTLENPTQQTLVDEYLTIETKENWDNDHTIEAGTRDTGWVKVSIKKAYLGDSSTSAPKEIKFKVTYTANAKERSSKAEELKDGISLYNLMKENASADTINFSVNSMTSGTNGIYTTTATEGSVPVYYYRGAADQVNNNVIFNNMCWKIIRTTETGGVKLIYNGTPTDGKCEATGTSTQIGTSAFNAGFTDNAYVGYMYGTAGSSTYAETHANTNESTIKSQSIDPWFEANFDENATAKLEDTVFCNDRSTKAYDANTIGNTNYSSYGALGYGINATIYGAAHRVSYFSKNPNPSLVCANANDKFTVSESYGNGALSNPVGLITLDEVVLAGYNTYYSNTSDYKNTTNYLHTGNDYWTFSPVLMNTNCDVYVGTVRDTGNVRNDRVDFTNGVRPVVSLADGTLVEPDGEGTSTKPYVVK